MKGKVAGMGIDDASLYGYNYDSYGRLNKITTADGDFNYTRLADCDLVNKMTRPNSVTTSWSYEPHRNLITQVANGAVSVFEYVNNAIGNRTSMKRSDSAFSATDTINYSYNSRSEVIGALSNAIPAYNFNYAYDPIGNRLTSTQEGEAYAYTSNALNQYTKINTEIPTYDADGNMLTRDGWTQVWNGENRMIATFKGNQRLEFDYDYMGRRIFKKVYEGNTLKSHTRFVYDDYKLVQELNALNNNALLRRYVWQPGAIGLDVPLSVFDATANQTYYYNTDANKNISDLTASNGTVAAHYEYTPFGSQTTATGSYTANPFRFSSEYFDTETELVYYNYRYYDTQMGRWLSKDPIGISGGINLYSFIGNRVTNGFDLYGLVWYNPFTWLDDSPPKRPSVTPPPANPKISEDPRRINCLGYACGRGNAVYSTPGQSMQDLMTELGYSCTKTSASCDPADECEEVFLFYVYKYQDNPDNLDPWSDPWILGEKDENGRFLNDFHAIRGPDDNNNNWTYIPANIRKGSKRDYLHVPDDPNNPDSYWRAGVPEHRYCCRRQKPNCCTDEE